MSSILDLVKYSTSLVQQYEREIAQLKFELANRDSRIVELERRLGLVDALSVSSSSVTRTEPMNEADWEEELPEWKSEWFYEVWGNTQPSQLKSYLQGLNEWATDEEILYWINHTNKGDLSFPNQQIAKILIHKRLAGFYLPPQDSDVEDLYEELLEKKKNNECMTSKTREQTDANYDKWLSKFNEIRGQTVNAYTLFGGWLPPRRLDDIRILYVTQDKLDVNEYPNQYVKSDNTFYFNSFKNSHKKKPEKFTLNESTFSYIESNIINQIKQYLNNTPDGKLFTGDLSYAQFRRAYVHISGFSCNAWRHFWESKINIYDGSPINKAKLQRWLSHTAAVAQSNYIADPNNIESSPEKKIE